jgi:glycosyltransferase involved in cell wall biosynthesis
MRLPRLAIVSWGIRRDLIAPLKYFTQFQVLHFYRMAEYGDLTPADHAPSLRHYRSPRDLYHQLVQDRPDVIQGVEPFSFGLQPYLWSCYMAARRAGAPLLAVTLENRPLNLKAGRTLAFFLHLALAIYLRHACLVVVLNEGARRNVLSCGVPLVRVEKLMWGTWGVDLSEFSPLQRQYQTPPTVLFAGRLCVEKGIFVLLDAFERVRTAMPESRLTIVGDGPVGRRVRQYVESTTGVTWRGAVKNRAMPEVLREADVVAVPSLTTRKWEEQVGMVAIQAMACGVPLVASRSGAIPEYVPDGEAGLLVPENDSGALAAALLHVLQDRGLHDQLAVGARAYAAERYDAAKNIAVAERLVMERCCAGRV